ncbi:MAG: histidine triad nucleotide-binding protein [Chloroflexi bacterium]|nr:histidine triad nucleotide-binding protein [Chloroflexota bacterium]
MAECIFDQIASGKRPSDVVYQDDTVMAFKDIHPRAPVHVLIMPKKHITSLADITKEDLPIVAHMMEVANIVARQQGTRSYKLVINTGANAGQVVMHLHMHLLAGRPIPGLV